MGDGENVVQKEFRVTVFEKAKDKLNGQVMLAIEAIFSKPASYLKGKTRSYNSSTRNFSIGKNYFKACNHGNYLLFCW